MRPHVLDFRFEPRLRALPRALEGHVLQEVGHPVVLLCLVPAARIDPHPDRRRRPVARLFSAQVQGFNKQWFETLLCRLGVLYKNWPNTKCEQGSRQ